MYNYRLFTWIFLWNAINTVSKTGIWRGRDERLVWWLFCPGEWLFSVPWFILIEIVFSVRSTGRVSGPRETSGAKVSGCLKNNVVSSLDTQEKSQDHPRPTSWTKQSTKLFCRWWLVTCTQNGHAKQVAPIRQSDIVWMDDVNLSASNG